jgi:hypothetical protein
VVLVTHNPDDIGAGDSRLDLDEAAATSSLAVLAVLAVWRSGGGILTTPAVPASCAVNHLHAPALSLPGRLPIRPG